MRVEDVVDRESLGTYLNGLPDDVQVLTARRVAFFAAVSVAPIGLRVFADKALLPEHDFTGLPMFGALSIAGVAGTWPTPAIDNGAVSAAYGARAAASAADAGSAAHAAAVAAASAAASAAEGVHAAVNAVIAAVNSVNAAAFWETLRYVLKALQDSPKGPLFSVSLDQDTAEAWAKTRTLLEADTAGQWAFWIKFYERVLAGKDIHAAQLAPILNGITKDDWLGDPALVNVLFDDVLAVYRAEDAEGSLSNSTPVDFSFDTYLAVMRMIGVTDTTRHLQDPSIVANYLADAQVQRELLEEFIDDMGTLEGGNFAGLLRKRAGRLDKEFRRTKDLTHIRAEKVVSLARSLETASKDGKANADIGEMLSTDLQNLLSGVKGLCRNYFGPAYLTLAPLAELNLEQIDQTEVIALFDEAVRWLEALNQDSLVPLDAEGIAVFQDMLDELRETRTFIQDANDDEFREMLEGKFSAQSGAFGLSLGRFYERSTEFAKATDAGANEVIKRHKQAKSLNDIIGVVMTIVKSSMGAP